MQRDKAMSDEPILRKRVSGKRAGLFLLCVMLLCSACSAPKEEKTKEKTVLELWHYWARQDSRQCLAGMIQEFNAMHEDIEVRANYIADEDFKKRLVLAAASGETPDLAIVDSSDVQYYDKAGILSDLSEEVNETEYSFQGYDQLPGKGWTHHRTSIRLKLSDFLLQYGYFEAGRDRTA